MNIADPKTILITGGSSGIGAGLARAYAAPGVTLHLSGRDAGRLAAVADDCRARGAAVRTRVADVTDADAMRAWIGEADEATPLDLVVANAGVSTSTSGEGGAEPKIRRIFATNVDGAINTVLPAIDRMKAHAAADDGPRGQIAIISSIAGFRGLPMSPAYSASKAAVKAWGEALRGQLMGDGIRVNVVCPGWVQSRLTDANTFPMPMLMATEKGAVLIKRGLAADKARIVFPWRMHLVMWLMSVLPPAWTDPLLIRVMNKRGGSW